MVRKVLFIALLLKFTLISILVFSKEKNTHYTGQQNREIKSLSQNQIVGYLNGKGMGFAKAAELNHYPGPKHGLEMTTEMNLSDEQIESAKNIYTEMHNTTSKLGKVYIQKEKELDSQFATKSITETELNSLLLEIAEIKTKIRFAHLKAHLQMKEVLSPIQIKKYDHLRGYQKQNNMIHSH